MRVFLAGTPSIALSIFAAIEQSDIEIAGVITNPPKARGRSGSLIPSPVSTWASEKSIPVFENGTYEEFIGQLSSIDLVLVVAYGRLIPKSLLSLPRFGWVNIHFSHLPEARGAAPVQRLIESGRTEIGYSLFRLDEGMDTGPIFHLSQPLKITGLTTGQVWHLLTNQAASEITSLLREISMGKTPTAQPSYHGKLALAPKITVDEARIDWSADGVAIARKIRAFNPAPSAWTMLQQERFIIHNAEETHDAKLPFATSNPGEILHFNNEVYVSTRSGILRLLEVQPFGKRAMSAADWVRGARSGSGATFE